MLPLMSRLLPKENFREPFGLPKIKVGSPNHNFKSPESPESLRKFLWCPSHFFRSPGSNLPWSIQEVVEDRRGLRGELWKFRGGV